MFFRCAMQYYFRYVEGLVKPPASAMILGRGVHASSEKDLISKRDYGSLLPLEAVIDTAADTINKEWDESGVDLDDKERVIGEDRIRGETIDMAVKMASLHHQKLAPDLNPKHIERPFTVELKGYPVDLSGTIDLQEEDTTLRDLKTRKDNPPDFFADGMLDPSFYGLAVKALDGEFPKRYAIDFLVKKRVPKLYTQFTERHEGSYRSLLMRIEVISRAIQSGIFTPCNADSWTCSRAFCGYYDICDYGSKAKVYA